MDWYGWNAAEVYSPVCKYPRVLTYLSLSHENRQEADVCSSALSLTRERKKSIDFTIGVMSLERGFAIPREETGKNERI